MGKIYVVGLGPGNKENMTFKAYDILKNSDVIIGYKTYIELVEELFPEKRLIKSFMKKEVVRCEETLKLAEEGNVVSLISSGDAGVYGMAGLMLEVAKDSDIEVEIIPGITSANASASLGGAPIVHDSVNISLSNLLTDWELIKKRIDLASQGDFVITLYNPKSNGRPELINEAREIMLKHKKENTPVLIARNVGREGEAYTITDLKDMLNYQIDMFSTVIIGNSNSKVIKNKIITPRGYKINP